MGSPLGFAGPWAGGGGRWPMVCGAARSAARRRRSQPARSSRVRAHLWSAGSQPSGTWSTRSRASPRSAFSGSWGWAATRPPGHGCTSCAERWSSRAASCSLAPWRSMSATSARGAKGSGGRGAVGKAIVVIAVEERGQAPGRVRMRRVPNVTKDTLSDFVLDHVARHSEVRTDGWQGYFDIGTYRYQHAVTNVSASGDPAHVVLPHVHLVSSLVQALDPRNPPGRRQPPPARLLPRRVHVPLQPSSLTPPGPTFLPPPAGRDGDRASPLPQPHQRNRRITSARAKPR
jgi:hypothetical protein